MNQLPLDPKIDRCYNNTCSIKNRCLRWLHREDLLATHYIYGIGGEECELLLDIDDTQDD